MEEVVATGTFPLGKHNQMESLSAPTTLSHRLHGTPPTQEAPLHLWNEQAHVQGPEAHWGVGKTSASALVHMKHPNKQDWPKGRVKGLALLSPVSIPPPPHLLQAFFPTSSRGLLGWQARRERRFLLSTELEKQVSSERKFQTEHGCTLPK